MIIIMVIISFEGKNLQVYINSFVFIVQDNYVVGIGSGTTIVYAVERLGKLVRCMTDVWLCHTYPKQKEKKRKKKKLPIISYCSVFL